MKNSIVISLFVLSLSLWFYWNSRPKEGENTVAATTQQAPEVATNQPATAAADNKDSQKKEALLTEQQAIDASVGYWIFKTPFPQYEAKFLYQFYISKIEDPQLHNGRQIEGLLFAYNDINPARQTIAKLELVKIENGLAHFKTIEKDGSNFYDNGSYYSESLVHTLVLNLNGTPSILAKNEHNETILSGNPQKLDPAPLIKSLKGKWNGPWSYEKTKLSLNASNVNDFINDYGTLKVSGDCRTEGKFKIRPIDENLFLISTGSASCEIGTSAFKGMIKDGKLKSVVYRQYAESQEVALAQD